MGNSSSKSKRRKAYNNNYHAPRYTANNQYSDWTERDINCLVDATHKWQAAYKSLEAQNLNLKKSNNIQVGKFNDLEILNQKLEDSNDDLQEECQELKEKIQSLDNHSIHLIIDGENVGISGSRCYDNALKKRVAVSNGKTKKASKNQGGNELKKQGSRDRVKNQKQKDTKRSRNRKSKRNNSKQVKVKNDTVLDPVINISPKNSSKLFKNQNKVIIDEKPKMDEKDYELNDEIFGSAIVSCILWLKENYPQIKITLVLYHFRHSIEKIKELIGTHCEIVFTKTKTDDLSILGIAKNSNGLVLSKDKFEKEKRDYPGLYDEIADNMVIRKYGFKCDLKKEGVNFEFHCSDLVEKTKGGI